jgi:hypothetical protein
VKVKISLVSLTKNEACFTGDWQLQSPGTFSDQTTTEQGDYRSDRQLIEWVGGDLK